MFENLITSFSVGQVDDRLRELGYGGDGPSQTIIRFETDSSDDANKPNIPESEPHAAGCPDLLARRYMGRRSFTAPPGWDEKKGRALTSK